MWIICVQLCYKSFHGVWFTLFCPNWPDLLISWWYFFMHHFVTKLFCDFEITDTCKCGKELWYSCSFISLIFILVSSPWYYYNSLFFLHFIRLDCMTAAAKRYKYLRRLVKFRQMDFEFAFWQMLYLFIAPQKVYRNFHYRKRNYCSIYLYMHFSVCVCIVTWVCVCSHFLVYVCLVAHTYV